MISVILVNHNGLSYIKSCIDSVLKSDHPNYEVIVVDNNSPDNSAKRLQKWYGTNSQVKLIYSKENLFFAGGCNLGAQHAKGDYLIFLNSDCVVTRDWMTCLSPHLSPQNILQPKIMIFGEDNIIDNVGGKYLWPGLGFGIGHNQTDSGQFNKYKQVDFANGTCLVIEKQLYFRLKGFDKNFKLFYEDVDLCLRAKKHHALCYIVPQSVIYHRGGKSIKFSSMANSITKTYSRANRVKTIEKNFAGISKLFRIHALKIINFLSG